MNPDPQLTLAAIARPGDHLIVGVHHRLSLAELEQLHADFDEHFPGLKVAFLDDCAGLQVYRPDPEMTPDQVEQLAEAGVW